MKRPKCEYLTKEEDCEREATHLVGFLHSDMFRRSCTEHLPKWGDRGRAYWIARLEGMCDDGCDNVIADILKDNQKRGAAWKAGLGRFAEEYQISRVLALYNASQIAPPFDDEVEVAPGVEDK
jgi:hypothetical protein